MILNVAVIPLLLGAVVQIKDDTKWNFDPNYVFHLNKTIKIYMDVLITENVTAVVECHLKVSFQNVKNVLFCNARNIIFTSIMQRLYRTDKNQNIIPTVTTEKIPDRSFQMTFDMKGVQDFDVNGEALDPHRYIHIYDIVPDIIEQFHINTDLMGVEAGSSMKNYENKTSGRQVISSFIQTNENTTRASKCNTTWIIEYIPSNHIRNDTKLKNETQSSYHLELLPMSYTNPADKTFLIQRTRMACTDQPKKISFLSGRWKIAKMDLNIHFQVERLIIYYNGKSYERQVLNIIVYLTKVKLDSLTLIIPHLQRNKPQGKRDVPHYTLCGQLIRSIIRHLM